MIARATSASIRARLESRPPHFESSCNLAGAPHTRSNITSSSPMGMPDHAVFIIGLLLVLVAIAPGLHQQHSKRPRRLAAHVIRRVFKQSFERIDSSSITF